MRILLLLGLMVLVVSGFGLIQLSRPTTPASFTKTLETLQAQREVLTGGPLRQTGSPAPEPAALTVAGILAETNRHRAEAGLPALTLNESLSQAAESKVTDMFAGQYFEHVSPSGQGPEDLVETVGYEYLRVGENLALGSYASDAELVEAWMDSPGHRENILKPGFSEIGLAASPGQFEGHHTWLAVQTFALPLTACPEVDTALQHRLEADQAAIVTQNSDLEARLADIEQERAALRDLANDVTDLAQHGNATIAEGNLVAQEQGNEAAQPLWDAGAALQEEAEVQQDEYASRQATFNDTIATYNADVDAHEADRAALADLVEQLNQQIRAFNAC